MHNNPSLQRGVGVRAWRKPNRDSTLEQRERKAGFLFPVGPAGPPSPGNPAAINTAEVFEKADFESPSFQVNPDPYGSRLPDENPKFDTVYLPSGEFSPRAVGGRHHFRYHSDSDSDSFSADMLEKDSFKGHDSTEYDEEISRSCIQAFSNLIGRRIARAMIDLVGIEPHPGPRGSTAMVLVGGRSRAESRSNLISSVVVPQGKKKKNKKVKVQVQSVMSRRTGGQISSTTADYSAYRRVLSNPWDCLPIRMGGETMQPTGIATLVTRFQAVCSGGGNLSGVFYPISSGSSTIGSGWISATGSAPYTYTTAAVFPGSLSLSNIATGGRVIAAGLRVMTTASATNNQGVLTLGCLPREVIANTSTAVTVNGFPWFASTTATQGFNEFQNYLSTESYPLKCGASTVYRPQDPLDFTFREETTDGYVLGGGVVGNPLHPFFVFGVTGAAGACPLFFEFVTHIEYTVSEGTTGVVNTGMGNMAQQTLVDGAKSVFNGMLDSTFEGVSGAFERGVQNLAVRAAQAAARSSGSFFSNTNNF
jgi:hypothetical protein